MEIISRKVPGYYGNQQSYGAWQLWKLAVVRCLAIMEICSRKGLAFMEINSRKVACYYGG